MARPATTPSSSDTKLTAKHLIVDSIKDWDYRQTVGGDVHDNSIGSRRQHLHGLQKGKLHEDKIHGRQEGQDRDQHIIYKESKGHSSTTIPTAPGPEHAVKFATVAQGQGSRPTTSVFLT